MHRALLVSLVALAAAAVLPGRALAAGGHYVFAGGTAAEQATVRNALDASSFNWSIVPGTTTVRIAPGLSSEAVPGEIRLDADLLDAGRYSWGVVQHEYAHQVDFFLLTTAMRATLQARLGAATWWATAGRTVGHAELGGERFASTLAWSFWQSNDNVMRPSGAGDEAGAMAPADFRALIESMLAGASAAAVPAAPPTPAHAPAEHPTKQRKR